MKDDHLGAVEGARFNEEEVEATYLASVQRMETATERLWRKRAEKETEWGLRDWSDWQLRLKQGLIRREEAMPHFDERIRGEREIERMGTMESGTPDMSRGMTVEHDENAYPHNVNSPREACTACQIELLKAEAAKPRDTAQITGLHEAVEIADYSPYINVTPQELKERLAEDTVKAKEVHARPINCSHGNHVPLMKMFSLDIPHVCVHCRSYYLPR